MMNNFVTRQKEILENALTRLLFNFKGKTILVSEILEKDAEISIHFNEVSEAPSLLVKDEMDIFGTILALSQIQMASKDSFFFKVRSFLLEQKEIKLIFKLDNCIIYQNVINDNIALNCFLKMQSVVLINSFALRMNMAQGKYLSLAIDEIFDIKEIKALLEINEFSNPVFSNAIHMTFDGNLNIQLSRSGNSASFPLCSDIALLNMNAYHQKGIFYHLISYFLTNAVTSFINDTERKQLFSYEDLKNIALKAKQTYATLRD